MDILGSFDMMAGKMVKSIVQSEAFKDVVIGFNAKIQEIMKSNMAVYKSSIAESLSTLGKTYSTLEISQSEMVKSMNAMAKSFASVKSLENSLASTKTIANSFTLSKTISGMGEGHELEPQKNLTDEKNSIVDIEN